MDRRPSVSYVCVMNHFCTVGQLAALMLGLSVVMSGCAKAPSSQASAEQPALAENAAAVMTPPAPIALATPTAVEAPFEPPFPERQELFIPPDLSTLTQIPTQLEGTDLVVRGFANFEGPRVILEIDGKVRVLKEGEEFRGIQVTSITPPMISLQRGGQRWTARLARSR